MTHIKEILKMNVFLKGDDGGMAPNVHKSQSKSVIKHRKICCDYNYFSYVFIYVSSLGVEG